MFRPFACYSPRLRFIDPPTLPDGTPPAAPPASTPPVPPADLGFPAETAIADMTPAQQAAYWRHYSRVHEAEAEKQRSIAAANADKAGKFDALELANASDHDKALIAARAEGVVEGSTQYLADAVTARLLLLTGKSEEDLAGALDLIDVMKLTTNGALDPAKVQSLASSIGLAVPAIPGVPPVNPVLTVLNSQQQSTAPTGGESIADMKKKIIAEATAAATTK